MNIEDLDIYLVGGAVRDSLLAAQAGGNKPVTSDRDWVVVGATSQTLLDLDFRPVGKDFPVFLHPHSKEEYALARTERKQGIGHRGFTVDANPKVTLTEDLSRRDLTINAIAQAVDGRLIDPYNGQGDIENRLLRHVSAAFVEDPLRVFRVARFAAQLPGFQVAPETQTLLRKMCGAGDLDALSAERVWQEFFKALASPAPERFFQVLEACGGLDHWLPECAGMELGPFAPTLGEPAQRLAMLPLSQQSILAITERLRAPKKFAQLALDRFAYLAMLERWPEVNAPQVLELLIQLKALHAPERLQLLLSLLQTNAQRLPLERELLRLAEEVKQLALPEQQAKALQGAAYGQALEELRLAHLAQRLQKPQS